MPCARRLGNAVDDDGADKNSVARHKHRTGIPGGGGGGGSCRPSSSSLLISRRSSFVVDDQQRPGLQGSDSRDNCESGSASRRRSRRRNKRNICSSSSCSFRINCPSQRWSSSGHHSSSSRMRNSWLITMFLFYGVFQKGLLGYTIDAPDQFENFPEALDDTSQELQRSGGVPDGPYFDVTASRNVTSLVAKTAYLNCRVHNLGNKTVSWIRHRDIHLLTVGRSTFSNDQRFQSVHNPQLEDWSLQVRYPQKSDSGTYECQVSTTPPIGILMHLSIVEPITSIMGGPDMYIDTGSTVNLTCIVRNSPEPPANIMWTHNDAEINYDSPRGGVSVITEKGELTTSYLLVQRARVSDSGKYMCAPSNANPSTVSVHILSGEHPAAMQHAGQLKIGHPVYILFLALLTVILRRR